MPKHVPVLSGIQPSKSAYSQVVEANGFVFVAGQVGEDPATGEVVAGGIEAETRAMFANLERCLKAVGLGLADVVKSTVYLVDIDDWAAYNQVFRRCSPSSRRPGRRSPSAGSSRPTGSRSRSSPPAEPAVTPELSRSAGRLTASDQDARGGGCRSTRTGRSSSAPRTWSGSSPATTSPRSSSAGSPASGTSRSGRTRSSSSCRSTATPTRRATWSACGRRDARSTRSTDRDLRTPDELRAAEAETLAAMRAGSMSSTRRRSSTAAGAATPTSCSGWRRRATSAWSYEVADTKLARRVKAAALLQMCVYADRLTELQGVAAGEILVVTGDGVEHPSGSPTTPRSTGRPSSGSRRASSAARAAAGDLSRPGRPLPGVRLVSRLC